jgi:hypothetical protein
MEKWKCWFNAMQLFPITSYLSQIKASSFKLTTHGIEQGPSERRKTFKIHIYFHFVFPKIIKRKSIFSSSKWNEEKLKKKRGDHSLFVVSLANAIASNKGHETVENVLSEKWDFCLRRFSWGGRDFCAMMKLKWLFLMKLIAF